MNNNYVNTLYKAHINNTKGIFNPHFLWATKAFLNLRYGSQTSITLLPQLLPELYMTSSIKAMVVWKMAHTYHFDFSSMVMHQNNNNITV